MKENTAVVSVAQIPKVLFNSQRFGKKGKPRREEKEFEKFYSISAQIFGKRSWIKRTQAILCDNPTNSLEVFEKEEDVAEPKKSIFRIRVFPQLVRLGDKHYREIIVPERPNLGLYHFTLEGLDEVSHEIFCQLLQMIRGRRARTITEQQMQTIWLGKRVRVGAW